MIKNKIILPKILTNILIIFGYYSDILEIRDNSCISSKKKRLIWFLFMQIYPIISIITFYNQSSLLVLKYSLSYIVPFQIIFFYFYFSFFPKWIKSDRIKKILADKELANKFNKHITFTILCLILETLLIIYVLTILPDSYKSSSNTLLNIIKKLFIIFLVPYSIVFSLLINLVIGSIRICFDYVCENIEQYLKKIEQTMEENKNSDTNIIPLIAESQKEIESLSLDINDLVGSSIGCIMILCSLVIFSNIYGLFSDVNDNDIYIFYIVIPSIISYGTGLDYILYLCTKWNTTFELNTYKWINKADLIPNIVKDFGSLNSFHRWLDNHESHTVRLFGKRGLKINYDLYIKVLSILGTGLGYLISTIMEYIE